MTNLNHCLHYSLIFSLVLLGTMRAALADGRKGEKKAAAPPALFIFGDSTVDPGNNNYIHTTPDFQANYRPYGLNGFFDSPTGRFSDGRVIVDFIAEYAKLPMIPPFLQPFAEFTSGVNFASSGAGILRETNQDFVIDLKKQLNYFEEVEISLTEKLGETQAKEVITEAVYFFSIGANDYMGGYMGNPRMQNLHSPQEYVGMVIGNLTQAIQKILGKGGRKFAFVGLGPLGCFPILREMNPKPEGGCIEEASALALAHNNALSALLTTLQQSVQGFKYSNLKIYNWFMDTMNNPSTYGFREGKKACCGAGLYGGMCTCGGTKAKSEYSVCDSAEDYVWWDCTHPTEKVHQQLSQAFWTDPAFPLEDLFNAKDETLLIADMVDEL